MSTTTIQKFGTYLLSNKKTQDQILDLNQINNKNYLKTQFRA